MTSAPTARRTGTLVLSGAVLTVLAACSTGGSPASAGTTGSAPVTTTVTTTATTPATTSPSTTASTPARPTTGTASGAGSAPAQIPAGAGTATTVDLDGDGAPDTLWLADVDGKRELGVATTSHGGSVVVYDSAAPELATASAAVLASGAAVVFLNTGRSVQLYDYRVENAGLVPVNGVTGGQYSFSLGYTDYGTGLTCEQHADGLHLYGENATPGADERWTVERTEVAVSAENPVARNGAETRVGTGLAQDDPRVRAAQGTTCGHVTAAQVAKEPQ